MRHQIAAVKQHVAFVKAKQHIQDHKNIYLAAGGGLVVGVVLRGRGLPATTITNNVAPVIAPTISPIFNNTVNFGGYACKIVKCLETGQLWETAKEAALAEGHTISRLSRHLNGHTEHLNGRHYEIIGMGTTR